MSQFQLRPPFAHWLYTSGALLRADAVRVTMSVRLFDEEVPRNEEGDPEGYTPEWLVQFPTPGGGPPGSVSYASTARLPWPMGPRP